MNDSSTMPPRIAQLPVDNGVTTYAFDWLEAEALELAAEQFS